MDNQQKTRILHVADKLTVGNAPIHGVTQLFLLWMPRFDATRFHVSICSLRGRDQAGEYLENIGTPMHYLNRSKFDPFTLLDLVRLLQREKIDILHLHGYGAWTFGRLAGKLCRVPVIVHEHMLDPRIPIYQRLADRLLAGVEECGIAISQAVHEFMVEQRYIATTRVTVVANGIPLDKFNLTTTKATTQALKREWRERLKIPPNHAVVGTVGRLSEVKGHRYLLEAAAKVIRQNPNVTFVIVGDGELRRPLELLTEQLGIAANVRFTGHCQDVVPFYALMELFIIASLAEGGPLTLVEALASGCAVIATDTIGLKDLIRQGQNGFIIPARNSCALATQMIDLLNDPSTLAKVSAHAPKTTTLLDVRTTVHQLEQIYDQLAPSAIQSN